MTIAEKSPLRLAVAQFDATSGDLDHNVDWHLHLLDEAGRKNAALVVFPELSLTGYCSDLLARKNHEEVPPMPHNPL